MPVPGDGVGFGAVAAAAAVGAGDVHIGKELHVKRHLAGSVAGGAAQLAGVIGERARLQARGFRLVGARECAAQVVEHAAIGGDSRAHVRADGSCIDELRADDAGGVDPAHAGGQVFACVYAVQRGNQLLQHQRGLAASGYAGNRCQPVDGQVHRQRVHGMQRAGFQMDSAVLEQLTLRAARAHVGHGAGRGRFVLRRQIPPDQRAVIGPQLARRAAGDHVAAAGSGSRAHFHQVVRRGQDARVVIDHHHRVAVSQQVAHDTQQAVDVGRV